MDYRKPLGTGPGPQTKDGCSVELYKRTPYRGELDALGIRLSGKTVLELGCGTGRLTNRLLQMGCRVFAIDDSDEMLACLPAGVDRKLAEFEHLHLHRSFEVVLIASYLYNSPLTATRQALGNVARSHLQSDGSLLLQVHGAGALELERGHTSNSDGITTTVEYVEREGSLIDARIRYSIDDLSWTHAFQTLVMGFEEIEEELREVGFRSIEWADESQGWLCAK